MWTVERLSRELADGRTTSRELLEQALARIADPAGEGARAFLKVYADSARAEACHEPGAAPVGLSVFGPAMSDRRVLGAAAAIGKVLRPLA